MDTKCFTSLNITRISRTVRSSKRVRSSSRPARQVQRGDGQSRQSFATASLDDRSCSSRGDACPVELSQLHHGHAHAEAIFAPAGGLSYAFSGPPAPGSTSGNAPRSAVTTAATSGVVDIPQQHVVGPKFLGWLGSAEEETRVVNYTINGGLIAFAAACVVAKAVAVDIDAWSGLSVLEIVRRIPIDNWKLYEAAIANHPFAAKACISGVVYSLGDLTAQTYEGRTLAEFDRARVLRSGLVGFFAHGPLSHLYYENLERGFGMLAVPADTWYLPLAKLAIDQTLWSVTWNSLYYILLGVLKAESPAVIAATVRSSWWDLLKAGWRLWPFAHLITYGIIPLEHRLLWVDMVELVWVTILSYYGQEQRARLEAEAAASAATAGERAALLAAAAGRGLPGNTAGGASVQAAPPTQVACALPGVEGRGGDFVEEIQRSMQVERQIVFEDSQGNKVVKGVDEVYGSPKP